MKILVDVNTREVVFIGRRAEVTAHGIDVGGTIYAQKDNFEIVDIDVPVEVSIRNYCYDAAQGGFYQNPNVVAELTQAADANKKADDASKKTTDLQAQMSKVMLALAKANIKV